MIIRRQLLAATIPACTTQDTRYFLSGVKVTRGKAESTNGHIAIRVTDPEPFADADFPYGPNGNGHLPAESALIPLASIQAALKSAPKRPTIPVLAAVAVDQQEGEPGGVILTTTDLENRSAVAVRTVEATFPDLDRVMPRQTPQTGLNMTLTVEVLEVLIAAVKASYTGKPSHRPITFTLPIDQVPTDDAGVPQLAGTAVESAILATWKGDEGITGVAIAMTCRL